MEHDRTIVLYTHPAFFEPAVSLVDALSASAEVHLVLEVNDRSQPIASFESGSAGLPLGLVAADPVLAEAYPPAVRDRWRKAASFHLLSHGDLRSRNPRSLRITRQFLRWVREIDADVLHVDDVDVSPRLALALATARKPCRVVMGCHDPDPHTGARHWWRKSLARALGFPRTDAIVVHHRSGRQALLDRHPRLRTPVHVVRLATYSFLQDMTVAPEAAIPALELVDALDAPPVVLFFGRLSPYKGIDLLYRAAPLVAEAEPGVRFMVVGGPVPGFVPPTPPMLGGGGSVETDYGYLPSAGIGVLFRQAAVCVLPYTDASQSGVLLTAYAFGCPVVATAVGGIPEYVDEGVTGLLVPPGDPVALATAITRCLQDTDLLARLRSGVAAASATDLSWERVTAELREVYGTVIRTDRSGARRRSANR